MTAALHIASRRCLDWFIDLHSRGIDLTDNAHLKVEKEAAEFAEEPSLEEAADVYISLMGAIYHRGWTIVDLAAAVHLKMEVNEGRTWAKLEDGTFQHT